MQVIAPCGAVLADRCRLANTPRLRAVGLPGLRDLEPGSGLLLRRCSWIHMFFMRFAIDAVFLDRENRVVKIVPTLGPWRVAAARGAASELRAGECAAHKISLEGLHVEAPAVAVANHA